MALSRTLVVSVALVALGACSKSPPASSTAQTSAPAQTASPAPAGAPAPTVGQANGSASAGLGLQAINDAQFNGSTDSTGSPEQGNTTGSASQPEADNVTAPANGPAPPASPVLIKTEVLLDRANFAPGVIDGQMGENLKHALIAYDQNHGLKPSGTLDEATWKSLTGGDSTPVMQTYTITDQDVAGPWSPDVGENFVKMSQQKAMGYHSPREMLAERFHMDRDLLKTLNPQADFSKAGTKIVVVDPGHATLPEVASIDVNKAREDVTAFGADHKVLAVFPATVGSTERPSPKGTWSVKGVAQHPDYEYDPSKLTWGPKKAGKLHIPPGPNGPVGIVWIALTAPDYGIHGTPDPHTIGKTASHGCVRLTNWDAEELSKAVKPGVKVTFITDKG